MAKELYTKQDLIDSINEYISVLEMDKKPYPTDAIQYQILGNVIVSLKQIVNDMSK